MERNAQNRNNTDYPNSIIEHMTSECEKLKKENTNLKKELNTTKSKVLHLQNLLTKLHRESQAKGQHTEKKTSNNRVAI